MTPSTLTFDVLLDEVDAAYQALRTLVIDRLPPATALDSTSLSDAQQRAVDRFRVAECALADYRSGLYESCSSDLASTA